MKRKLVALILGLIVILVTPAVTSCEQTAKITSEYETVDPAGITAPVHNLVYEAPGVAARDVALVQDEQPEQTVTEDEENWLLKWQNILNIVLLVVSSLLAVYWKRAKAVLDALSKGLEDNSLTKQEMKDIINAWKQNA